MRGVDEDLKMLAVLKPFALLLAPLVGLELLESRRYRLRGCIDLGQGQTARDHQSRQSRMDPRDQWQLEQICEWQSMAAQSLEMYQSRMDLSGVTFEMVQSQQVSEEAASALMLAQRRPIQHRLARRLA